MRTLSMLTATLIVMIALGGTFPRATQSDDGGVPLSFEINHGQSAPEVKFVARGRGYSLFLLPAEAVLSRPNSVLRMSFVGASRHPEISGVDPLPGTANYFLGSDRHDWHTNIPTYARVRYQDVYPGIDVVYYGRDRQLEFDLIVRPRTDPAQITMHVDGVDRIDIGQHGELVLRTPGGEVRQARPTIYQSDADVRYPINGRYVLRNAHDVGFEIGAYDSSRSLVIDPALAYSTYLGGSQRDSGAGVAVDKSGHAYVIGSTTSPDFPMTVGTAPAPDALTSSVFVTKFSADGRTLLYSTTIANAQGTAIAIDPARHAFLTGNAFRNFPLVNAFQPTYGGDTDAFVTKLSPNGDELLYSTYLGGEIFDGGGAIAVNESGTAYVAGSAESFNFPVTAGAFQTTFAGGQSDAFVAKFSPAGELIFSTFLGGGHTGGPVDDEGVSGMAIDRSGIYVVGSTGSPDFPVKHAFQATKRSPPFRSSGFLTKMTLDGSALIYSTYLGGSLTASIVGVDVDPVGRAAVVGRLGGPADFPLVSPLPFTGNGFVSVFSPNGAALVFSSLFPASVPANVMWDGRGNLIVSGEILAGEATTFPLVNAIQTTVLGDSDLFITKIDRTLSRLVYSTFLGGEGLEFPGGLAVDPAGSAYVTGTTQSAAFPVVNPFQAGLSGTQDAFLAKLADFNMGVSSTR